MWRMIPTGIRAPRTFEGRNQTAAYRVYGITLWTDTPLAVSLPESRDPADVHFELTDASPGDPVDGVTPVYIEGTRWDGQPDFSFWALEDRAVIRITGAMDFHLWPDRIVCHLYEAEYRYLVEIALLGMVLALWLERRGTPTFHGSAIVIDGRAVAFLGSAGSGKTSTAAACVRAGHALLSDDLLALDEREGVIHVRPGHPQFRMWPEQAVHFTGTDRGFVTVDPVRSKLRVPVGEWFGSFASGPVPLAHVYVLERAATTTMALGTRPMRPSEGAMALVRNSFLSREVVRYGIQRSRLEFLARIVADVPIRVLTMPLGLDRLPEAVAAIADDVRTARR